MALEIERKFLPKNTDWQNEPHTTHHIVQGYLARSDGVTVRVRISETPKRTKAMMCVKGIDVGDGVPEEEFEIKLEQAQRLLLLCKDRTIEKYRHHIKHKGLTYEVDEFLGGLAGHVLIEVELERKDQNIDLPVWVGKEVTLDKAYTNARFATKGWPRERPAHVVDTVHPL
ncbi:MAG TPA: CYTH domain-containing protein [Candidatus Paceibacterota bacterium]